MAFRGVSWLVLELAVLNSTRIHVLRHRGSASIAGSTAKLSLFVSRLAKPTAKCVPRKLSSDLCDQEIYTVCRRPTIHCQRRSNLVMKTRRIALAGKILIAVTALLVLTAGTAAGAGQHRYRA